MMDQNNQSATGDALFTPITFPILRSVDPRKLAALLKERERCKLEVEAKIVELPTISVTPYKEIIDGSLLRSALMVGKLGRFAPDASNVSELTEEQI